MGRGWAELKAKKNVRLKKELARVEEVSIPPEWMPLFIWHQAYHYKNQRDYIDSIRDYWECVFCAGNGTGKTHTLYWNVITLALGIHPHQFAKPPLSIKVLMNDFEHGYYKIFTETCLQEQVMPDGVIIKPMLVESDYMVTKWPTRDNKSLMLYNGSELFFQTSEQKKKQHSGTNFDMLICDEEPVYQAYDESKRGLRTAKGGGKILHAYTPPFDDESKQKGPSWTKQKLIEPAESSEETDICVTRAAMKDNPAITEDFIRRFSKGKTEEQLRIQLYGEYPTWGQLIFPAFQDDMWDPKTCMGNLLPYDFEIPWNDPGVRFEMAVDWHRSKPPAVIWAFEYVEGPNKGDVVVFDELAPKEGKGLTISKACTAIREVEGWRNLRIKRWGDPKMRDKNNELISGFNAWEAFRHGGIRLTESWNRDPYVGYSTINDFLSGKGKNNLDHPRLYIRENCKTLRYNMRNHFNVPTSDGDAKPDTKFSDYCVNLKYIMLSKARKQKKRMDTMGRFRKWGLTSFTGKPIGVDSDFLPYMRH